jgi:hypothetical protein
VVHIPVAAYHDAKPAANGRLAVSKNVVSGMMEL